MWFSSWLRNCKTSSTAKRSRAHSSPHKWATCRPQLETLEDRCLPSFLAPVNYYTGGIQKAVAVGDFNNDKNLDIVTTEVGDLGGSRFNLLQGNQKGQFQYVTSGTIGTNAYSVAVGDFNNDKNLDIIATNFPQYAGQAGSVVVLLGNGNGTFRGDTPGQGFPYQTRVGSRPVSVAVGDFNGDGKLDAVTVGWGNQGQLAETDVLLGRGNGTFTVRKVGPGGVSVAVGDVNGDGKLDIVTANGASGGVSVLRGNGDGTFQAAQTYNATSDAEWVALGDFNGDGKLDIITSGYYTTGSIVLLNNGDGTFRAGPTAAPTGYLAVADFNRDGKLDIVASGNSLLLGNGDGTFGAAQNIGPAGYSVAVAGDFNHDGFPDMALVGEVYGGYYGYGVDVLINAADWSTHHLALRGPAVGRSHLTRTFP
jgi:hypothetical protein